jgi:ABC-type dipeptide/oligopeptide/nickel transport system permease component
MGLMDAKEFDPRPAQRRNRIIATAVVIVVAVAVYLYLTRFNSEKAVINHFFQALEQKNFDAAYGLYQGDPDWKQHPNKYSNYTENQFVLDWGPSSEYGPITSHHVDCALKPKSYSTGVVIVVTINHRAEPRSMWVEAKSKAISDSPVGTVVCHGQQ